MRNFRLIMIGRSAVLGILILCRSAFATDEQEFNSPEDAVQALSAAAQSGDTNALHRIFGPAATELVSRDLVQAGAEREMFLQRIGQKVQIAREGDGKASLELGSDHWPFPIPLVNSGGHWFFDTAAGKEEILNRRVGRNELKTIQVCRAYVDAQREYASEDRNGDQVLEFAQHLRSSPGAHDGLYWPAADSDDTSPLGPLIAQARQEGYRHESKALNEGSSAPAPYHGYYFKILTRQGKHAPGGKYNYIINGHMIAGFALAAWPAQWGNTGVMTFIVNQDGLIYEKNLGAKTASVAEHMTAFDPDDSWTVVH